MKTPSEIANETTTAVHLVREQLVRAGMIEALRHAVSLCEDYDNTDELLPILLDLMELLGKP